MKATLLALAVLACVGDDMGQQRSIPPPGAALTPKARREASQTGGQSFGAFRPADMGGRSSPTTLPRGERDTSRAAAWSPNEALVMRLKGLDGDMAVASVTAYHGLVSVGTETFGMALYEVVAGPGVFSQEAGIQPQFILRKLPGAEWFKSYAAGGATSTAFAPSLPVTLERYRSYAVAVVWSVAATGIASSVSQQLIANEAVKLQDPITLSTGFPTLVPLSDTAAHGIASGYDVMRVEVNPARAVNSLRDFY